MDADPTNVKSSTQRAPERHRIGLFGGSFNPVHKGHLLVAQAAKENLELDRLYFIPAARSPFKPDMKLAPDRLRVRMLRLALAGHTDCEVDLQELCRGGLSFTIDTVMDYADRLPGAKIFYLIGADHVALLPKWREAKKLAELVDFAILSRLDAVIPASTDPFRTHLLDGLSCGISSSNIRARVRSSLPLDHLVPKSVAEVIFEQKLYFT